jgi:hypothetical protein
VPGGVVTAGNASQFSDGAGACVVVSDSYAQQKNLKPLGRFLGFAVAGCEPDEMGIGPVFAVPKVLQRLGLKVDDIDLWELNEAFAVQVLYCADRLGIPMDRLNVNGGAIARRPPLRHERPAPDRPCADRRQAPRRQEGVRDDVHRRRHGRGRRLRGAVTSCGLARRGGAGQHRAPCAGRHGPRQPHAFAVAAAPGRHLPPAGADDPGPGETGAR